MSTRPVTTNNPFALIQKKGAADAWQGLTGQLDNGFLVFDTPINGARAGFINLYNTYLKRGINTTSSIIPIYAPDSIEPNGKNRYVSFLTTQYKIEASKPITTSSQILNLARGITHFEAGKSWLSDSDLKKAYNLARQKVKLPELTEPLPKLFDSPIKSVGVAFFFNSTTGQIMDKTKAILIGGAAILTYVLYELGLKGRGFKNAADFYKLAKANQLKTPTPNHLRISSPFGYRQIFGAQQYHNGIDIPAPEGTPIYAPYSGKIKGNYYNGLGGNQLTLDSGAVVFGFAHLQNKSPYPVGQNIQKGQLLGYVGNTGRSTGAHLHFTVTVDNKKINPATVFTQYK
jgi:murein DD-endopeptidase MepM/ murein hydrolase activator NlpD